MAYTRANKLPDRYKVVFRNATGERIRHELTQVEFNRKDRDQYVLNAYAPTGRGWETFDYWFVPFIETFDTPSKALEPGMYWEGANRHGESVVVWCPVDGQRNIAKSSDVVVTRTGEIPETIEKKPR